ncbi:MAG TPA: M20/M25/M40 family metallo-hydrolase [Actinomycetota bacterium]|nr:M20/M25/M40 family metallo-hydrolase [Actinomycetota bacterium]
MDARGLLADLVRIDTTNPPGNESPAAERLEAELEAAGMDVRIFSSPAGRANLIGRVEGDPARPALVLLSHLDVVGVEEDKWSRSPFGAEEADGHLWGRGALDMKAVAVMHACAAVAAATSARREIVVAAVADEEVGGVEGARWLVQEHPDLVGFRDGSPPPHVLGEGAYGIDGLLDRPILPIALGEKQAVRVAATTAGDPGHGALPPRRQAIVDLARFVDDVAGYGKARLHPVVREQLGAMAGAAVNSRKRALQVLASAPGAAAVRAIAPLLRPQPALASLLSDVVSVTTFNAGYKNNVVPGEAAATLDCRLLPDTDIDSFLSGLRRKADEYGVRLTERSRHGGPVSAKSSLFETLRRASAGVAGAPEVVPTISPAMTDVRFFRARGAIGYGWVPLVITPELIATIHGHDERIPLAGFDGAVEAMTRAVRETTA